MHSLLKHVCMGLKLGRNVSATQRDKWEVSGCFCTTVGPQSKPTKRMPGNGQTVKTNRRLRLHKKKIKPTAYVPVGTIISETYKDVSVYILFAENLPN